MSDISDQKSSETDEVEKEQIKSVSLEEKSSNLIPTDKTFEKNPDLHNGRSSVTSSSLETSESGNASGSTSWSLMIASSLAELKKIRTTIQDIVAEWHEKDKECSEALIWSLQNLKLDDVPCSDTIDNVNTEPICSDIEETKSESDDLKTKSSQCSNESVPSKDLNELVENAASQLVAGLNFLSETATRIEQGSQDHSNLQAAAASGIINPQQIESASGVSIKLLDADEKLLDADLEAEINLLLKPLCDSRVDRNGPELLSDIGKFSIKIRGRFQKLGEECKKVIAVMLDRKRNRLAKSECKHESSKKTNLRYLDLFVNWSEIFESMEGLMKGTQIYIELCCEKAKLSTRAYDYVNVIIAVLEITSELFHLCYFAVYIYHFAIHICDLHYTYDDFHFLLNVEWVNVHFLPLLQKLIVEFQYFEELDTKFQNKSHKSQRTSTDK